MKLVEIAREPTLVRLTLDDADTIAEFNEPLEFWIYDRQPIDTFLRFAGRGSEHTAMIEIVKQMVLDESGAPVIRDNAILPNKIMLRVVSKLMDYLGN
jgi:hypothetical protein